MLNEVVQPLVKNGKFGFGSLRKMKMSAPNSASGTEPEQDDERIAEAIKLRREDEEDEDEREQHRGQELVAFGAQLPRFAGVIDLVTFRQNLVRFVLEKFQGLVERPNGHALDLDRVELLQPVQRARHGRVLDRGDRAEWDQLVVRSGDINVFELARIEPLGALDLRNDFVAAPCDVEAIDEVAADHRAEIRADLLHVEPELGHLVTIEHDLGLRLIDLGVDQRRKANMPLAVAFC